MTRIQLGGGDEDSALFLDTFIATIDRCGMCVGDAIGDLVCVIKDQASDLGKVSFDLSRFLDDDRTYSTVLYLPVRQRLAGRSPDRRTV
jgi:hypothetical protein